MYYKCKLIGSHPVIRLPHDMDMEGSCWAGLTRYARHINALPGILSALNSRNCCRFIKTDDMRYRAGRINTLAWCAMCQSSVSSNRYTYYLTRHDWHQIIHSDISSASKVKAICAYRKQYCRQQSGTFHIWMSTWISSQVRRDYWRWPSPGEFCPSPTPVICNLI